MTLFGTSETTEAPATNLAEILRGDTAQASFGSSPTYEAEHGKLPSTEPLGSVSTQEDHIAHPTNHQPTMRRDDSPGSFSGKGDSQGKINGKKIKGKVKEMVLGREFAETEDGQKWTRKGNKSWLKLELNAQESNLEPVILAVIRKRQVEKADHWCLFVGKEGNPGSIYQVTGDHLYMIYDAKDNINIFASASFRDAYTVGSNMNEHQQTRVAQIAANTSPPTASNPREITENCQTWIIKVLWQLQREDIIIEGKMRFIESLVSPI